MYPKFPKKILYLFLFILSFLTGIFICHLWKKTMSEDSKFTHFTEEVFQSEIQSNTLSLHYTLADPENYGIHNYPITLGNISAESIKESEKAIQELLNKLQTFHYDKLSTQNQLTYEIIKLSLNTEMTASSYPLLHEPLSPSLGIQAQLPVLLAEYTFRNKQDIEDYLSIIQKVPDYFEEILSFEKEKSDSGYFMSDSTAERIIQQCEDFIATPKENYLISVFNDKVKGCEFLSEKKCKNYQKKHQELILNYLIPAYTSLSEGLSTLKGTGKNPHGLSHYEGGQEYYQYLIKSSTGLYDSIETLTERLFSQMHSDYLQLKRLLTVNPDLPVLCQDKFTRLQIPENTEEILDHLLSQMKYDFPDLENPEYTVKYVHEDLEEHLSPAFYLTPPIDTMTPNSIYLNNYNHLEGLSLYSTLAHEGFPGHMYQTLFFSKSDPDPVRQLFSNGGYIEGWASYIESYAYQYAPVDYEVGQYAALNRSFHLCLYSLLDIYIHYYGWTESETAEYLSTLGITDTASQKEIYQILIEDPANYLKYCLGSLAIRDLKYNAENILGSSFDTILFHEALLTIGPAPFPVIEKFLYTFLQN